MFGEVLDLIAVQPFMAHADIPVFVCDLSPLTAHLELAEVPATKGRRVVVAMNLHKHATFANVTV